MDRVEDYIWGRIDEQVYLQDVVSDDSLNSEQMLLKVEAIQKNLNVQLRLGVEENYPRLLEQVAAIETLDAKQVHFDEEMKASAKHAHQLANLFDEMYKKLSNDVTTIKHLTLLNRLLEDGLRCDELVNSWASAEEHELLRCAEIVHELNTLLQSNSKLCQLNWLRKGALSHIDEMRTKTRARVIAQLKDALSSLSCFGVSTCLKALSLLFPHDEVTSRAFGESSQTYSYLMQKELNDIMTESVREFDGIFNQLCTTIAQNASEKSATKLLLQLSNRLHSHLEQYQLLGVENVQSYARQVGKVIAARSQSILGATSMVLRLLQSVHKGLTTHSDSVTRPIRDALTPLKLSILSQSLSSLFAAVDAAFSTIEADEFKSTLVVEKLNSGIRAELQNVSWDAELRKEMESSAAKTLHYIRSKIEQQLVINSDTLQLSGRVSRQQSANYQMLNVAHNFVKHWPQAHMSQCLSTIIETSIDALLGTMRSTVSLVLASMHSEKLSEALPNTSTSSLYMKELCNHLKVFRAHISQIEPLMESVDALPNFLNFVIEQLALHFSFVRPLSSNLASRFTKDLDYLCRAGLQPFNCKSSKLLNSHSIVSDFFRQCSSISPNKPDGMAELQEHVRELCNQTGSCVPAWLVVQLLINVSGKELPLAHESVNWSLSTFIDWFNSHTEVECFKFFLNMLLSYKQSVVARGATQFVPLYPIINEIVESHLPQ